LTGATPQTVVHGGACTAVTANAPGGWHFVKWTKAGADHSTDNPLTVTNITEAMTLVANFAEIPAATVAAAHLFYNHSAWDGDKAVADADDDLAISGKEALRPGQTAAFVNYTGYAKGINGIMVDIANLAGTPTAEDFIFRTGNGNDLGTWTAAPAPASVTVRAGAGQGGSARVTLIWADADAVKGAWLQVTVKAGGNIGLADDYVFYFGNARGEVGNSASDAIVNATDMLVTRNAAKGSATVADPCDHDRDQAVGAADILVSRDHATSPATMLRLITVP